MVLLELAYYSYLTSGGGRFAFPAIAPLAVLVAAGWAGLIGRVGLPRAGIVLSLGALAVPPAVAWLVVQPAFSYPPRLRSLPASAHPAHAVFDGAELIGVESTADDWIRPGEPYTVTLYWRLARPVERLLNTFVHVDSNDAGYAAGAGANYDGPSGAGRYPPNFWRSGEVVVDRYSLRLAPDTRLTQLNTARLSVRVGMYAVPAAQGATFDKVDTDPPEARDSGYEVAAWKLPGKASPEPAAQPLGEFASGIDLMSAKTRPSGSEQWIVDLHWRARARPTADFTIFVQALARNGELLAQHDSYPLNGRYPTSQWSAGEDLFDSIELPLFRSGADADAVIAGMYALPSTERVPTLDGKTFVRL